MLTCDAFGVMPFLSKLSPEQAMYHFLSGYTAKVAGTEKGVTEPSPTFSTCFGAPFMALKPSVYAKLLGERVAEHKVNCWLINTGWTGGPYGEGHRIDIGLTRAMVHAALQGKLTDVPMEPHPIFRVLVPKACPDVPAEILDPRNTWRDKTAYDQTANELARKFTANFEEHEFDVAAQIGDVGPVAQ